MSITPQSVLCGDEVTGFFFSRYKCSQQNMAFGQVLPVAKTDPKGVLASSYTPRLINKSFLSGGPQSTVSATA